VNWNLHDLAFNPETAATAPILDVGLSPTDPLFLDRSEKIQGQASPGRAGVSLRDEQSGMTFGLWARVVRESRTLNRE